MKVHELMSPGPAFCTVDTPVTEVARMMRERDCGAIPVLDSEARRRPVGMITDRDIAVRLLASDHDVRRSRAQDAMTPTAVVVGASRPIEDAEHAMRMSAVRRIVVVDAEGACTGMLSLADLAAALPGARVAALLKAVSQTSPASTGRGHAEVALDEGLSETFPASDPVSVGPARRRG